MNPVTTGTAPPVARSRLLPAGTLAVLLAALPFTLAAGALVVVGRTINLAGDQALIALDTGDAAGLTQLLGPYSRYGWTHPGPVWFYLLAGPYILLGRSGAALCAAVLLGQALAAAAVVVAVAGRRSGWRMPLAALVVVVYLLRVPPESLTTLWNPAVLALPLAVLILLAARAATGSLPALAWAAFAGTFLVQTHLGTVPVVAGVAAALAVVLTARILRRVRAGSRADDAAPDRTRSGRSGITAATVTVVGLLATVLAWVPPALQQLRGSVGNIGLLIEFFTASSGGGFTLSQGMGAVIRMVAVPIVGVSPPAELVAQPLAGRALIATVAFLGCALALALAGWRTGAPQGVWTGVLTAVALLAAAQAVTGVRGPVFTYLLEWAFALPLALAVGWCDVIARLLDARPVASRPDRQRTVRRALWALVAVTAVLAVVAGMRAARNPAPTDSPGAERLTAALAPVIAADLPRRGGPDVVLDISGENWPAAAGLALWLREDTGREVVVPERWVALFGADHGPSIAAGIEGLPVLTVVSPGSPTPEGARQVAASETERGPVQVWLAPARP